MTFIQKSFKLLQNKLHDKVVYAKVQTILTTVYQGTSVFVVLGGGYSLMYSGYELLVSSPDAPSYADLLAANKELLSDKKELSSKNEELTNTVEYFKEQLDIVNKTNQNLTKKNNEDSWDVMYRIPLKVGLRYLTVVITSWFATKTEDEISKTENSDESNEK